MINIKDLSLNIKILLLFLFKYQVSYFIINLLFRNYSRKTIYFNHY